MNGTKNQLITWLLNQEEDKKFEIKEFKEKRSLSANAYYHVLKSKLARVLSISNDEMHEQLIKRYSDIYLVPLQPHQEPSQIFPYYDYYKETEINSKKAVYYKCYVRSSIMDTKQFSKLLDGLISEAKECDIEVLTPQQLAQFEDYDVVNNK